MFFSSSRDFGVWQMPFGKLRLMVKLKYIRIVKLKVAKENNGEIKRKKCLLPKLLKLIIKTV